MQRLTADESIPQAILLLFSKVGHPLDCAPSNIVGLLRGVIEHESDQPPPSTPLIVPAAWGCSNPRPAVSMESLRTLSMCMNVSLHAV